MNQPAKKKFNAHVGLATIHLIFGMYVIYQFLSAPQSWIGIMFVFLSFLVWPLRFLWHWFSEEERIKEKGQFKTFK